MLTTDDEHESAKIFIFKFCKTKDPKDPEEPIKLFPRKRYLDESIDFWLDHRLTLWAKSRRMLYTWLFCELCLWDAIKYPARYSFLQSRELADAGMAVEYGLLWRVLFSLEQLDECVRPKYKIQKKYQILTLLDTGSTIRAVSADFDAFRQYGATFVLADEVATQPNPQLSFMAALPAVEGVGRFTGVSNPNGENYFFRKVMDLE